jgi:arabinofuranosyltransferase
VNDASLVAAPSHATRSPEAESRRLQPALAIALLGLVATTAFLSIGPALDDAYIVYRYVARFLGGLGLTFNDGEYVEGFTSLIWVLVLSAATWLTGLEPPIVSVGLNYLAIVCTAITLPALLKRLNVPVLWAWGSVALMATSFSYYRVAYIGLEFGLYSFLLVLFFYIFLPALRTDGRPSATRLIAAGLVGGVLFGTRPESLLMAPLVCGTLATFSRDRSIVRTMGLLAVPWLLTMTTILAWRLAYYGEWLPNSIIAKSAAFSSIADVQGQLLKGSAYLFQAYRESPALAYAAAVILLRFVQVPARRLTICLLLIPIFVAHVAVLQNGGDWMPYFRFVNVQTPLYIASLLVAVGGWRIGRRDVTLVCLAVFAALHVLFNARHFTPALHPEIARFKGWMDLYRQVGNAAAPAWKKGDILMAESIGMLGYAAPNVYIHDPLGLTDSVLAHDHTAERTLYGRKNWEYSLGLDPSLILIHHWPHQRTWSMYSMGYPANYSFYTVHWRGEGPARCLYAILRNDRAEHYARALGPLLTRRLAYDEISYPCVPDVLPAS